MADVEQRLLIDTNILLYATLEKDPRFERSRDLLLSTSGAERYVSVQNLAEMFPNLTGPKMKPPDDPALARAKIQSIASLPTMHVLPLTGDVVSVALELCAKYAVVRQRYFDLQLVATMLVHGIATLLTENVRDFQHITEIRAVNPYDE